jgi:amphi-Trp domain-containing protein
VDKQKGRFRHQSIQDQKSLVKLLKSITEGLQKGELVLSDEQGEVVLSPQGLIHLKLAAEKEGGANRLTLRVGWQDALEDEDSDQSLSVNHKKIKRS